MNGSNFKNSGRIPVALAHHSLQAGGLWAVINHHPTASIKAKERSRWDTLTQREGVGVCRRRGWPSLLGLWRQKVLGMPRGDKRGTGISFASAAPLVMIVLTRGKADGRI